MLSTLCVCSHILFVVLLTLLWCCVINCVLPISVSLLCFVCIIWGCVLSVVVVSLILLFQWVWSCSFCPLFCPDLCFVLCFPVYSCLVYFNCLFDPVFCLCCALLSLIVMCHFLCHCFVCVRMCCVALYSVSGYVVLCFTMCLASGLGGLRHHWFITPSHPHKAACFPIQEVKALQMCSEKLFGNISVFCYWTSFFSFFQTLRPASPRDTLTQ